MQSKNIMEYKGFKAQIMEAERLVGDHVHGLPSGRPLSIYHSEEFVEWPENWMRSPGVFVVPVRPNKGLWFSWTLNDSANTAVLPTVKGCNPITGMQTSGFHLERYDTKCPKHGIEFIGDRYCSECGYRWPFGNYVSSPNTLWLDVWNTGNGVGRQFYFTEDDFRDIANKLISRENTVPAFGFAFYTPRVPRPVQKALYRGGISDSELKVWSGLNTEKYVWPTWRTYTTSTPFVGEITDGGMISGAGSSENYCYDSITVKNSNTSQVYLASASPVSYTTDQASASVKSMSCSNSESERGLARTEPVKARTEPVKEVSIGAGAKISQNLAPDPNALDTWKDTPDAVMTIYFVFQEKFEELKAGGMKDLNGKKEGFLDECVKG